VASNPLESSQCPSSKRQLCNLLISWDSL